MPLPDWDNTTPKEIRKWGEELSWRAQLCGEIEATLRVNCKKGRRLHAIGITYDDRASVVTNLVHILEVLCERGDRLQTDPKSLDPKSQIPNP